MNYTCTYVHKYYQKLKLPLHLSFTSSNFIAAFYAMMYSIMLQFWHVCEYAYQLVGIGPFFIAIAITTLYLILIRGLSNKQSAWLKFIASFLAWLLSWMTSHLFLQQMLEACSWVEFLCLALPLIVSYAGNAVVSCKFSESKRRRRLSNEYSLGFVCLMIIFVLTLLLGSVEAVSNVFRL